MGRHTSRRALALFPIAAACAAQVYVPGPQVLTFFSGIDDSDQPYALYVPKRFDPSRKYPLVVSLHGAGSNHRLNLRRVFGKGNLPGETDADASRVFPPLPDVDFLVASPFARGSMGYQGIAEQDVYAMVADVKRRFPVDEDRVYLTGLAMGGGGTLWLGLTRPDLWAAIAAVCPSPVAETEELAANALNFPVHLFHGEHDSIVPVAVSRMWHKRLLDLGTRVEYIEFPATKHNSWDNAYRGARIFDWFARFRRERYPDRVRFASRAYRYNSAYWARIDGLTPGVLASIDARFTGENAVEIATRDLDGFTLLLDGHSKYAATVPLVATVDGVALKLKPKTPLSFSKSRGKWVAMRFTPPARGKGPGAEGPMDEAIAARHVYVYGTGGGADAEEIRRRERQARDAAEWSTPQRRLSVALTVAADTKVSARDLRGANLVLFGTSETNSLIARFTPGLPLALHAGAADYGLAFIAPAGGRYVLVNSGLSWWTGAGHVSRPGVRANAAPFQVLSTFGDYILFKGSLENVVAEGRFDRDWRVPASDAVKMRSTGAVVIR